MADFLRLGLTGVVRGGYEPCRVLLVHASTEVMSTEGSTPECQRLANILVTSLVLWLVLFPRARTNFLAQSLDGCMVQSLSSTWSDPIATAANHQQL